MTASEEARWIEQAKQGDVAAFEALIAQYERKVYNLAYRLTGNPDDAADMAQEAFVRVYTKLGDFRGDSSFYTWLCQIVSNVCRDELRRRQRQQVASMDATVEGDEGEMNRQFADPGDGPEQALDREETRRLIREAIASLDEEHQEVLILRDFQDLSYEQIRAIITARTGVECSLGTVKSRLNRARNALKEKLLRAERELLSPRFVSRSRRRQGNEL